MTTLAERLFADLTPSHDSDAQWRQVTVEDVQGIIDAALPASGSWIEHDGKGTPDLPHSTLVEVRFADGTGAGDALMPVGFWHADVPSANNFVWSTPPEDADIVAYRVVTP